MSEGQTGVRDVCRVDWSGLRMTVMSGSSPEDSGQVQNDLQGGEMGRVLLQSGVVGRGSGD